MLTTLFVIKHLYCQSTKGNFYRHENFLLAEKATELDVEVVWTQGTDGKQLKETFKGPLD